MLKAKGIASADTLIEGGVQSIIFVDSVGIKTELKLYKSTKPFALKDFTQK